MILIPDRVYVVGTGYNKALFTLRPNRTRNRCRLSMRGSLSHAKKVPWMLRSLSWVDTPGCHLNLVGSGSGALLSGCLIPAGELGARVTDRAIAVQSINYCILNLMIITSTTCGRCVRFKKTPADLQLHATQSNRSPTRSIIRERVVNGGCQTLSISNSSNPYQKPVLLR